MAGKPAIAFLNHDTFSVKYVAATDVYGAAWGSVQDVVTDFVSGISLEDVGGMPAISYAGTDQFLWYDRASAADGSAWYPAVTADTVFGVGSWTSVGFTDTTEARPAVGYYNWSVPALYFVGSSDASGGAWNTPVLVDSGFDLGWYVSMTLVSPQGDPGTTYPAMAYLDFTNFDLKYARATSTDGSTWGTPLVIDSNGDQGDALSLGVYNGTPVIAYHDATNGAMKVISASDTLGDGWNQPVVIDGPASASGNCSFAVVAGVPSVAYTGYDQSNSVLCFRRAFGGDLTKWGAREIVDIGGFDKVTMIDAGGNPGISYTTNSGLPVSLKYAYRTPG